MTIQKTTLFNARKRIFTELTIKCAIVLLFVSLPLINYAQKGPDPSEETLIDQYVQSKNSVISFDASNIKQFWVDKSVVGMDNNINIIMNKSESGWFESIPLKIQLANVAVNQDCKVVVITENSDVSFSIADSNLKTLVSSVQGENFLYYCTYSTDFQLVNTQKFIFNIIFSSKKDDVLKIKKIFLSFSQNKDFLSSPGELHLSEENISFSNCSLEKKDEVSFSVTGARSSLLSLNNIMVREESPLKSTITIKNIGEKPTTIYVGYIPYTISGERIDNRTIPYKGNNKILKVISSEANSNKITVDDYPEWTKGCFVALNAKEDLSDFPNCSYIDGSVVEVNKIAEGKVEIVFDKPLIETLCHETNVLFSPVSQ